MNGQPPILQVVEAGDGYEVAHLAIDGEAVDVARQLDRASYTVLRQGERRYPTEKVAADVAQAAKWGWFHGFVTDRQPRAPRRHV